MVRRYLKTILVPTITRNEEETSWTAKIPTKKFGDYYYSWLFVSSKWIGELLEALHTYGHYDKMNDIEYKLEQLINNRFDDTQPFAQQQTWTSMTQEVRWLIIVLLVRNYTHHETEIPVAIMDGDIFTKSFYIIISSILFTFSLIWR
ncbi:MAG: hypothetical protein ACE5R6_08380 [Candidatus Heimdallarchaeota archaeon]